MNIRGVVGEIHARVEREIQGPSPNSAGAEGLSVSRNELALLHGSYERLYQMRGLIGRMPPSPDTLRARVGARLIRLVRRMLFWYTPQIERVQTEVTNTLGSLARIVEMQSEMLDTLSRDIRALRASAISRPDCSRTTDAEPMRSSSSIPVSFEFALQDHFRGSERDTKAKLKEWLRMILDAGGDSAGTWLDIGCGRGEWIALGTDSGYRVSGIDANAVSVDHCRQLGLCAEQSDALDYLGQLPDETLSVVTMFHFAEHLPAEYLLQLFPMVFRKLRMGGLIAVETPNPGNLLMGSHYFWNDPTHQRPLPRALLSFMLEWSGFEVLRCIGLNPFPTENHLPWIELDAIRQVDDLLYNERDYGVLGRK